MVKATHALAGFAAAVLGIAVLTAVELFGVRAATAQTDHPTPPNVAGPRTLPLPSGERKTEANQAIKGAMKLADDAKITATRSVAAKAGASVWARREAGYVKPGAASPLAATQSGNSARSPSFTATAAVSAKGAMRVASLAPAGRVDAAKLLSGAVRPASATLDSAPSGGNPGPAGATKGLKARPLGAIRAGSASAAAAIKTSAKGRALLSASAAVKLAAADPAAVPPPAASLTVVQPSHQRASHSRRHK